MGRVFANTEIEKKSEFHMDVPDTIMVSTAMLALLREVCWKMRDHGSHCPLCVECITTGGNRSFSLHSEDCKFRVGHEYLSGLLKDVWLDDNC